MLLERLEVFIALARERHFGRAAEACGITQPTLSSAIKQLEASLGAMLVKRGSRFGGLTPEGELVLAWAQRLVGDSHAMREEIKASRLGLTGRLRIAAIPAALGVVSQFTAPFREKYPGVTFSILSRTSVEILSLIGNFDADIGITYLDNEPLGRMISVPLYSERYHLVTSADGPFADAEEVSWANIAGLSLCLLTPDMQNRRIIDQHLAEAGASVRPTLESNSMLILLSHVRTGKWSSIMPGHLIHTLGLVEAVRTIPIVAPEASHLVGLVAAHRDPHTPLVTAFLNEAQKRSTALIDGALTRPAGR